MPEGKRATRVIHAATLRGSFCFTLALGAQQKFEAKRKTIHCGFCRRAGADVGAEHPLKYSAIGLENAHNSMPQAITIFERKQQARHESWLLNPDAMTLLIHGEVPYPQTLSQ